MQYVYDPKAIEEKWLAQWASAPSDPAQSSTVPSSRHDADKIRRDAEKIYLLFAFAYPSGTGLHVGHVESKTALDIMARYYRMMGRDVFFPVGWDAFGLPAENYAIKTGVPPAETTKNAINTFRTQVKRLGISYDWQNEMATSHPEYYRWTQWLFLQFYAKGLAYQGMGVVNWCPSCQTVLANEQVVDGKCERCSTQVIQKELKQWYFKITQYQDELLSGLDQVDWPNSTKQHQRDWIGKSAGLQIEFQLEENQLPIWTKFWETIFGVTFVVIAPEKFLQLGLEKKVPSAQRDQVKDYIKKSFEKTEEERKIGEKQKTGVDTGLWVTSPVNGEKVPLYVADYVLMNVGTGIVMGVPAHDERDFVFAKKFGLPIKQVVQYADTTINTRVAEGKMAYEGEGALINSGQFDGQEAWGAGKTALAEWLIEKKCAHWQTTYKLRDWLISRQRYWGAPIPIVYDPDGKPHPVKEEHLPWLLPTDVDFRPTGESPLTRSKEFLSRTEKLYGKGWRPEFDTMDTFVDSSWYFFRYTDARNSEKFADSAKMKKWLPVDLYLIGPEHIVLHLLYARFFTKFLRDEGHISFDEPFLKMRHQGMIMGPDGKKMSKSKGNVINPDEIIEKFGADTLRVYEMFMGPLEADKPWDTRSVVGMYRFLQRIYGLVMKALEESVGAVSGGSVEVHAQTMHAPNTSSLSSDQLLRKLHQTIQKVSKDIPALKFNTAIASLMILVNALEKNTELLSLEDLANFIKLLAPFAPFLAEELWAEFRQVAPPEVVSEMPGSSVHNQTWPSFEMSLTKEETVTLAVQINGKVRATLVVDTSDVQDQSKIVQMAKEDATVQKWLQGKKLEKEIYVPGRLVSFVVK